MVTIDNSNTQTGNNRDKTSHNVMKNQRKFTPYNQNERKVQHIIRYVNHKTIMVLLHETSMLDFVAMV